jgi:trigger factor
MQVTEVANEGLKRAYTVVVPASSIALQKDKRLKEIGKDAKLPGFRPARCRRRSFRPATARP